jgi:polysaccharide chain length determinant protein (PEP-CTERM system associated)
MQEILEQVLEHVRGAWRFRRAALITAWIVAPLGWLALFMLPDVYEANSRVFVDTKTALSPVLENLVLDQDVNAQLNLVRQSLLAGPQLEPVAEQVGLIDRGMSPQERIRTLNEMRDRVEVMVSRAGSHDAGGDAGSIYAIRYRDVSRDRAIRVVEILQNNLIENTLGGKRTGSESAQRFLETQIADYEMRLRQAEERLAAFKKANVGLMPTEQGGYFTRLQQAMDAAAAGQTQLAIAMSRREELQRQLRGEGPIAAAAGTVVTGPGGVQGPGGDTLSRIQEAQARLDDLLLRFTDRHPDVVAQRETLEQLKQRRQEEIEALRRGDPNAAAASGASANPVYQSIQLQLNQVDVEIASLRRQIADHQARIAEMRNMLDTMPQVEAEYARLNRDYDVTRAQYTALVERLEKTRLGEEATTSGSVRFDIIEPPNSGFRPVSPKRSLFVLAVLVFALGAGVGVAVLLHLLMPVFASARTLAEVTSMQVLGTVGMAWADLQRRDERRMYLRYGAAVLALMILGVVVLLLSRSGLRLNPVAA